MSCQPCLTSNLEINYVPADLQAIRAERCAEIASLVDSSFLVVWSSCGSSDEGSWLAAACPRRAVGDAAAAGSLASSRQPTSTRAEPWQPEHRSHPHSMPRCCVTAGQTTVAICHPTKAMGLQPQASKHPSIQSMKNMPELGDDERRHSCSRVVWGSIPSHSFGKTLYVRRSHHPVGSVQSTPMLWLGRPMIPRSLMKRPSLACLSRPRRIVFAF